MDGPRCRRGAASEAVSPSASAEVAASGSASASIVESTSSSREHRGLLYTFFTVWQGEIALLRLIVALSLKILHGAMFLR